MPTTSNRTSLVASAAAWKREDVWRAHFRQTCHSRWRTLSWAASTIPESRIGTMNPPLTPPRRGTDTAWTNARSPLGGGSVVRRIRESLLPNLRMYCDHGPVLPRPRRRPRNQVFPSRTRRRTRTKGRFMESKYRGAFRATSLQSRSGTEFVSSHYPDPFTQPCC